MDIDWAGGNDYIEGGGGLSGYLPDSDNSNDTKAGTFSTLKYKIWFFNQKVFLFIVSLFITTMDGLS